MTSRSYFKYQHKKDTASKGFFTIKTSSKKNIILKYILRIFLIFLFIGSIYFFFFSNIFALIDINLSVYSMHPDLNVPKVRDQEIKSVVTTYLNEPVFFLLKKNNFFVFDINDLKKLLQDRFSIKEMEIKKNDFHTIEIIIKEQSVSAIWFNMDMHYYIDENGYIIDKSPIEPYFINISLDDFSQENPTEQENVKISQEENIIDQENDINETDIIEMIIPENPLDFEEYKKEKEVEELLKQRKERQEAYIEYALLIESGGQPNEGMLVYAKEQFIFPVILDESKTNVVMGDQVITKDTLNFLLSLHKHLTEYTNTEALVYTMETPMHPRINAFIKDGYWIHFLSTQDLVKQLNNVALILEQKINYPRQLEYLDVRYDDKVFYKYKESD